MGFRGLGNLWASHKSTEPRSSPRARTAIRMELNLLFKKSADALCNSTRTNNSSIVNTNSNDNRSNDNNNP